MGNELYYGIFGACLTTFGNIIYFIDIYHGKTYPHIISFGLWTIIVGFNTYVLYLGNELFGLIPSLIMTLNMMIIFVVFGFLHIKKLSVNWFDYFCLCAALILIAYWITFRNLTHTVILTIIIDFIAYLPTFKKGWLAPWSETIIAYFIPGITQIFTLLAIETITFENSVFWIYLFIANITFFCMVFARRWYLKGWQSVFE